MVSVVPAPSVEPDRSWFDFYHSVRQRVDILVADSPFAVAFSAYVLSGELEWVTELSADTGPDLDGTDLSATATAIRGFLLARDGDRYVHLIPAFRLGLQQCAVQRVPRRGPSVHWNAQLLLGIAVGLGLTAGNDQERAWLASRMEAILKEGSATDRILAALGLSRIAERSAIIDVLGACEIENADDAAVVLWALLEHGRELAPGTQAEVERRLQSWEHRLLTSDPSHFGLPAAAAAAKVAAAALRSSNSPRLGGVSRISDILRRFPVAVARDPCAPEDEYQLQRVLWTMLAGCFPDLQDEVWLAKFGVYHPRADFAVESLRVVVEAKYARAAADFRKIQEEITGDAASYTSRPQILDRVIAVVYDRSSSEYQHERFRQALLGVAGVADVVVFSAVSTRPTTRAKTRGRSTKGTAQSGSRKTPKKRLG